MKVLLQLFAVALFVFMADFVWLGMIMPEFYQQEIGGLMRRSANGFSPRLLPAALVYILIPLGIVLFVGPRVSANPTLFAAAAWGALFGLVVYGIYDLSNMAVLDRWTWRVTFADIVWGIGLCATSAVCMKLAGDLLGSYGQQASGPP